MYELIYAPLGNCLGVYTCELYKKSAFDLLFTVDLKNN